MDYVDWCLRVLNAVIAEVDEAEYGYIFGTDVWDVSRRLLGNNTGQPGQLESVVASAIVELQRLEFLSTKATNRSRFEPTDTGREHAENPAAFWRQVCGKKLRPEEERLLRAINRLSERREADHASIEALSKAELSAAMGWHDEWHRHGRELHRLEQAGLVSTPRWTDSSNGPHSTYAGLVWEHRRSATGAVQAPVSESEAEEGPATRVFISYAREDEQAARRLYPDLTARGIPAWLDKENLLPGQRWRAAIGRAMRDSRYFLALLSSRSLSKRGYVQKELKEALELLDTFPDDEIFLVPVRLDECSPTNDRLRDLHWVDLFPSWEKGLEQLLRSFRGQ